MLGSRARVDAALVLALAFALLWTTRWFDSAPELLTQGVSPAFFPRLLLCALILLALLLPFERSASSAANRSERSVLPRLTVIAAGVLVGGVLSIQVLGVLPAVGIAAGCLSYLWGERRIWWLVAFAALLPVLLYAVFSLGLGVYFATGSWFGRG